MTQFIGTIIYNGTAEIILVLKFYRGVDFFYSTLHLTLVLRYPDRVLTLPAYWDIVIRCSLSTNVQFSEIHGSIIYTVNLTTNSWTN